MNPLDSVLSLIGKGLDKLFPDANQAAEFKAKLLTLAQQGELDAVAADLKDKESARQLAIADIAGGNNITRFAAAFVRPVFGFMALYVFAASAITHVDMTPQVSSVVHTVIEFYFGGRVIEKVSPLILGALKK